MFPPMETVAFKATEEIGIARRQGVRAILSCDTGVYVA